MQENTGNYIIGSGISGLIWSYYHPDYTIISPDAAGGLYAKTHMVWLHQTGETIKLLTDLGFPIIPKRSYIGYSHGGCIYDYQTEWLNKKIIQRKMTPWNEPIDTSFQPTSTELSLSKEGDVNYMNTLDVDLEELVRRVGKNAKIKQGFVTKVTPTTIEVKKDFKDEHPEVLEYKSLVSTMAAPFFWKAYGTPKDFKSASITNVIVAQKPEMFDNSYEMVYYYDQPFSRISHLNKKWALEFTGEISKEEFQKMYPGLEVLEHFIVKHGRIWDHENVSPQDNIIFSGRFSQWKHKVVTEHVTKQAIDFIK